MESQPLFVPPHTPTEDRDFKPYVKLPEHLQNFQEIGVEARKGMSHTMKILLGHTDLAALRANAANQDAYREAA